MLARMTVTQRLVRLIRDEGGFLQFLIPALTSLVGHFLGSRGGGQPSPSKYALPPELNALYQGQLKQFNDLDPFRQAILHMAFGLLPKYAREGYNFVGSPSPAPSTPTLSSPAPSGVDSFAPPSPYGPDSVAALPDRPPVSFPSPYGAGNRPFARRGDRYDF